MLESSRKGTKVGKVGMADTRNGAWASFLSLSSPTDPGWESLNPWRTRAEQTLSISLATRSTTVLLIHWNSCNLLLITNFHLSHNSLKRLQFLHTIRRLAVHSFTFFGSILYFLQTSEAPNIPLGEFLSSVPGLVDFDLSIERIHVPRPSLIIGESSCIVLPIIGASWYVHLLSKGETSPGLGIAGCDQNELSKFEGWSISVDRICFLCRASSKYVCSSFSVWIKSSLVRFPFVEALRDLLSEPFGLGVDFSDAGLPYLKNGLDGEKFSWKEVYVCCITFPTSSRYTIYKKEVFLTGFA